MGRLCMELYLEQLKKRYVGANRMTKTLILHEFFGNSGFHRKHAIRLLSKKSRKRAVVKKAAEPQSIVFWSLLVINAQNECAGRNQAVY